MRSHNSFRRIVSRSVSMYAHYFPVNLHLQCRCEALSVEGGSSRDKRTGRHSLVSPADKGTEEVGVMRSVYMIWSDWDDL